MSWLSAGLDSIGLGGVNDAFASITPWNDANPFGSPQALNQNWDYNPATATTTTSAGQDMGFLNQAMNNMGGQAGLMNQTAGQMGGVSNALMGAGQNFLNQSQSFADGSNPMYARMRQNMMGDLSSQATMGARQGAEALAGMGAGSKGLRDIIAGKQSNTAMQQVGSGYESMLDQGLGLATTYGGMGMQGMQGAGSLLNMAGGLQQGAGTLYQGAGNLGMAGASLGQANNQFNASQANQMSMFNADAQNQATEFGLQGNYNQAMNNQQRGDSIWNQAGNIIGGVASAKMTFLCIPEGTMIDTPVGMQSIEHLKAGDAVIGFDGELVKVLQKHEYAENPDIKRFLKIHLENGTEIDTCDMHRINDVRAKNYNVGNYINNSKIIKVDWYNGVERSFDLLTEDKGYRIGGVPINSMIEELNAVANLINEVQ
mgnify:CR=1 FL=1|tara:strand:+ start:442 stop:1725 length:1284 start_codon:yes stop_codon:yes gene_type:complete